MWALLALPNGDVLAGGDFGAWETYPSGHVARFNHATSQWTVLSGGPSFVVRSLALLPNGDIVAGGGSQDQFGFQSGYAARCDGVTGTWTLIGGVWTRMVNAVVVLPDGAILAGDRILPAGASAWTQIAAFGGASVSMLAVLESGKVLLGGSTSSPNGSVRILRVYQPGTWTQSNLGMVVTEPKCAVTTADGRISVGGWIPPDGYSAQGWNNFGRFVFADQTPPQIVAQPRVAAECTSGRAQFTVVATGGGALSYIWRRASVPIDAAANPSSRTSTLVLNSVVPGDEQVYSCVVSNDCGSVTSNGARLMVDRPDTGVAGGSPGHDGVLDANDFVAFITLFFGANAWADVGMQGALLGSDGLWDSNDLVVFIDLFFRGCGP